MLGRPLTTLRKASITRKEIEMNKRYMAACIMLTLAFALWFIATARADEVGYYQLSDLALILVGLLLGAGAFPVSGDLNKENDESEDFEDD